MHSINESWYCQFILGSGTLALVLLVSFPSYLPSSYIICSCLLSHLGLKSQHFKGNKLLTQYRSSYPRPVPMSTAHRAQRIWLTLAICIFCSLSTTSALNYFIADSCGNYPIIPDIITSATSTIYNTWRRNKFKNLDPAFQTAFNTIFSTQQSSDDVFETWAYYRETAFEIVNKTTWLLGTLQRSYDQDTFDIRIVCDDDTYGGPNDSGRKNYDITLCRI